MRTNLGTTALAVLGLAAAYTPAAGYGLESLESLKAGSAVLAGSLAETPALLGAPATRRVDSDILHPEGPIPGKDERVSVEAGGSKALWIMVRDPQRLPAAVERWSRAMEGLGFKVSVGPIPDRPGPGARLSLSGPGHLRSYTRYSSAGDFDAALNQVSGFLDKFRASGIPASAYVEQPPYDRGYALNYLYAAPSEAGPQLETYYRPSSFGNRENVLRAFETAGYPVFDVLESRSSKNLEVVFLGRSDSLVRSGMDCADARRCQARREEVRQGLRGQDIVVLTDILWTNPSLGNGLYRFEYLRALKAVPPYEPQPAAR